MADYEMAMLEKDEPKIKVERTLYYCRNDR